MNQDRVPVMKERDYLLLNLNQTLDRLQRENIRLRQLIEDRDEILDWYINHWEELGHIDTTLKFKQLREDIQNAEDFGKARS